jgi:hypothetical protein
VAATPTIVKSLPGKKTVFSILPINTPQQDNNVLNLFLVFGVIVPLFLITVGTLWLSVRWLINRR